MMAFLEATTFLAQVFSCAPGGIFLLQVVDPPDP